MLHTHSQGSLWLAEFVFEQVGSVEFCWVLSREPHLLHCRENPQISKQVPDSLNVVWLSASFSPPHWGEKLPHSVSADLAFAAIGVIFSDKLKHKLLADSLSEYFRKSNFKPISISVVARNSNARAQ